MFRGENKLREALAFPAPAPSNAPVSFPFTDYLPELTPEQGAQLAELAALLREWNAKINLVSRKDVEHLEQHHLLHSLALARAVRFPARSRVLDVGTGGGLPGLPLAILFPQTAFFLCDSIGKKITAVQDMATRLGLKNVQAVHKRAEQLESKWDFVLGRAVSALPEFLSWTAKNLRPGTTEGVVHGVLYLKGSLYREELATLNLEPHQVWHLQDFFADPYYAEKYLIHLEARAVQLAIRRWVPPEPSSGRR